MSGLLNLEDQSVQCEHVCFDFYRSIIETSKSQSKVEFRIMHVLRVLMENNGQVVSRDVLHERVWDDVHVGEYSLNRAISVLRREFSAAGLNNLITTIPRRGYRFDGELKLVSPSASPGRASDKAKSRPRRTPGALILGALAFVVLVGSAAWFAGNVTETASAQHLTPEQVAAQISPTFNAAIPERQPAIDRRAIRSALSPLLDRGMPVDTAVATLVEYQDFEEAIRVMREAQDGSMGSLTPEKYTEFLHQIAALAFDRQSDVAIAVYLEILLFSPDDLLALSQVSKLYVLKNERREALAYIEQALAADELSPADRLDLEMTRIRASAEDFSEAAQQLERVHTEAEALGQYSVAANALRYQVNYEWLNATVSNAITPDDLERWIGLLGSVLASQEASEAFHEIPLTKSMMGLMLKQLDRRDEAIEVFSEALALERLLHRPTWQHAILTNLATTYLEIGDLERGARYNDEAIAVLRHANLASQLHYNWMLASKIAHESGQSDEACRIFRLAMQAWPPSLEVPGDDVQLESELGCAAPIVSAMRN